MKKLLLIFILFKAIQVNAQIKLADLEEIQLIPPITFIYEIQKGNKPAYSDSLSNVSSHFLEEELVKYNFNIVKGDSLPEGKARVQFENDINELIKNSAKTKEISDISVPDNLLTTLKNSNKRYHLLLVSSGVTRARGNYGKEVGKGVAMGILTMGMYYQVPVKGRSNIRIFVVDTEENKVLLHRQSLVQDRDPLEQKTIEKQFKALFKDVASLKQNN